MPAAQKVFGQGRIPWARLSIKGANPVAYFKTAVDRQALRLGLAIDRHSPNTLEPRVETKDREGLAGTIKLERQLEYNEYINNLAPGGCGSGYEKREGGVWHSDGSSDCLPEIPLWLKREDEWDVPDWDKVARYVVPKPKMFPIVAKALRLRFEEGYSRTVAVSKEPNPVDGRRIEAAWKWIDRNLQTRIAPLLRMGDLDKAPPMPSLTRCSKPRRSPRPKFVPPADALRKVIQKSSALPPVIPAATSISSAPMN